jgi:hypothetical protein
VEEALEWELVETVVLPSLPGRTAAPARELAGNRAAVKRPLADSERRAA